MNRTKEFIKIVNSTNFPQKALKDSDKEITKLFNIDNEIKLEIESLSSVISTNRIYEAFRIQSRLENVKEKIYNQRKMLEVDFPDSNSQEAESFSTLLNILRSRTNKYTLRVNDLIRKKEEQQKTSQTRRTKFVDDETTRNDSSVGRPEMDVVSIEQYEETTNIRYREREAITNHISEIGQIMEEIGIHVSMQEESFKRIDELMTQTDTVFDTSISLLRKTLSNIKSVRSSIIKFFIFWFFIVVIFWLLRR
ncbi:hypothetical protein NGRA_2320 [Nosema granulosis]|uniref:t-SNARE coiled-coil homology domain-containing protein n=1 Tax=Nosema granulosis TaxID=83296 RepID=A0A9P6KYJ7_9MICR|nr:hypothetical protein NGRA_2320 [Nosema granulosis]